ncbi:MAG: hypothetical protein DCC55_06725 [Chloroflexi bacterium]|nr:MAG: hypothetical protein DCC55_06725 [Chloroflexota bacterium]
MPTQATAQPSAQLKRRRKVVPTYDQHITVTPKMRGGKAGIVDRRISVADVAMWYLRQKRSIEEIVQECGLSHAQVHAALTYYYDHQAEIEAREAEDITQAEALRSRYPSKLQTKVADRG